MPVAGLAPQRAPAKSLGGRSAKHEPARRAGSTRTRHAKPPVFAHSIQPKLAVSKPGDDLEREADRVADHVMQMPAPVSDAEGPGVADGAQRGTVQRAAKDKEKREDEDAKKHADERRKKERDEEKGRPKAQSPIQRKPALVVQRQPGIRQAEVEITPEKEEEEETAPAETEGAKATAAAGAEPPADGKAAAKAAENAKVPGKEKTKPEETKKGATKEEEKKKKKGVQKKPASPHSSASEVPDPATESRLSSLRSRGEPLPRALLDFFGPRFQRDFRHVRVHHDTAASRLADSLDALAFTAGDDIVFAEGEYEPNTVEGRRLIAHELTHVLQQQGGLHSVEREVVRGGAQRVIPTELDQVSPSTDSADGTAVSGEAATANVAPTIEGSENVAPSAVRSVAVTGALRVQRQANTKEGEVTVTDVRRQMPERVGALQPGGQTLLFDKLTIPGFKARDHRRVKYEEALGAERLQRNRAFQRSDVQREVWDAKVSQGLKDVVSQRIATAWDFTGGAPASGNYVVEVRENGGEKSLRSGNVATLSHDPLLTRPRWDRSQNFVSGSEGFQVDHILEQQVGNVPANGQVNDISNLELLKASLNSASGQTINQSVNEKVDLHREAEDAALTKAGLDPSKLGQREVKDKWNLRFSSFTGNGATANKMDYWRPDDISTGEHLGDEGRNFRVGDESLLGSGEAQLRIKRGEQLRLMGWKTNSDEMEVPEGSPESRWLRPYKAVRKSFKTKAPGAENLANLGKVTFTVPDDDRLWKKVDGVDITIARIKGARYAGEFDPEAAKGLLKDKLGEVKGTSPITFDSFEVDLEKGITAKGTVHPGQGTEGKKSLFKPDAAVPVITIEEGKSTAAGTVPAESVALPGPIQIKESSIEFHGGDAGLEAKGSLAVEIRDIGQGKLDASISEEGVSLAGSLTVDSSWFKSATVSVAYDSKAGLSGGAELELETGNVFGVEKGTVKVNIADDHVDVGGSAELNAFGIQGKLDVAWAEATGLTVTGNVPLPAGRIPGITGGSVDASITRSPEGQLSFGATGHVTPNIPGVAGEISVGWKDDIFVAKGTVGLKSENLEGSLTVGVTNQALGADGQPSGKSTENFIVFGGGTVTALFGRFLKGTADIRVNPAGELELAGKIAIAGDIELFPQKEITKRIFSIHVDIPIAGITVAGKGVGIFATIGGGLDARASIGPGKLTDVSLGGQFNPSHPERTVITGTAQFDVPADAGLRLFVNAGVGASLLVVDVRGQIQLGAALGVDAAGQARLDVRWTPKEGLAADASLSAKAHPKFAFDISGLVTVDALLIGTVYEKRWELAKAELGSDLEFGIALPVHFKEGTPFDVKLSDVVFTVPEIEPRKLLEDVLKSAGREERHES